MGMDCGQLERAKGVPPDSVFEPTNSPPPAPPQGKRHRLSNQLYEMASQATVLEKDFSYQYDYNQHLVEQLAAATRENRILQGKNEELDKTLRDTVLEKDYHANEARRLQGVANDQKEMLSRKEGERTRPARLWRGLALAGWLLAILSCSVLAYEKISGKGIDKPAKGAIITLTQPN